MVQFQRCVGLAVAFGASFGLLGACGGGDSKVGGSYASIASAIDSPSGTVDSSSAVSVGEEFEKLSSTNLAMGMRRDDAVAQQSTSGSQDCPAGGNMAYSGSGSESSGRVAVSYNDCCLEAGCCVDGAANMYYSSAQTDEFSYCASYDVSTSCEGASADIDFNGCFGATGEWVYVIEVDGETFAVSGSYGNGSGTLEIRGENGTFTCTYSNDSGSCSGTGGESFTF